MDTLIINRRRELPLKVRLLSDVATIFLWGFWIYLWRPFFHVLWRIVRIDAPAEEIAEEVFDQIHAVTFTHALMMLLGTSAILIAIAKLPKYSKRSQHLVYEPQEYARFFGIQPEELKAGLQSQVCTIYHNAEGHITKIETGVPEQKIH